MRKLGLSLLIIFLLSGALFAQANYWGTRGLLRTMAADNQGRGFLSIALHGNYFQTGVTQDIVEGTPTDYKQRHSNGYLSAAFAPFKFIELSGGVWGLLVSDNSVYGNDNPTKFGFGDAYTGLKLSYNPIWWFSVGGYGFMVFPTGSSELKNEYYTGQETTFGGLGAVTFDLTDPGAHMPVPVRIHLNAGMHTGFKIPGTENDYNLMLARVGMEVPAGNFTIFADYSTEISSLEGIEFSDNPMRLTPGVRFDSPTGSFDLGVEIGLGNTGVDGVRNFDAMDWKVVAGFSFITRIIKELPKPIYAEVTGRIIDADNGKALIATVSTDDTTFPGPIITSEDGFYRVILSSGAHNVIFDADGYEKFTKSIVVEDSMGIPLDVSLNPLVKYGTLTGKVSDANTGEVLSGTIMFPDDEVEPLIVDPKTGVFKTQLPVGTYTIELEVPEYHKITEVVVIEKDKATQKDISLRPLFTPIDGTVTGIVTDQKTGALLEARVNVADENFAPVITDSKTGSYKFVLPAGTYNLIVEKDDYITATQTIVVEVEKTTVQDIAIKPKPMGMITGKVTNVKDKMPIEATINIQDSGLEPILCDENGIYKANLKPGTYTVTAEFPDFIKQAFPVVIKEDETAVQNFELIKSGEKLTLRGIYFDLDKATIKPESRPTLDEAIKILKDNPDIRVKIEGHTDSQGSDDYNMGLSQRRADSVKSYLVTQGNIDASRIQSIGMGEGYPIASNDNEEGRSMNRRIEFIVLD
ncbi:carboxypeptidase regulatory-like domain-containing protein [bacterium]|nr:carboxypeptidase regulatory-like domain-containing protein [bacterium]